MCAAETAGATPPRQSRHHHPRTPRRHPTDGDFLMSASTPFHYSMLTTRPPAPPATDSASSTASLTPTPPGKRLPAQPCSRARRCDGARATHSRSVESDGSNRSAHLNAEPQPPSPSLPVTRVGTASLRDTPPPSSPPQPLALAPVLLLPPANPTSPPCNAALCCGKTCRRVGAAVAPLSSATAADAADTAAAAVRAEMTPTSAAGRLACVADVTSRVQRGRTRGRRETMEGSGTTRSSLLSTMTEVPSFSPGSPVLPYALHMGTGPPTGFPQLRRISRGSLLPKA